MTRSALHQKQLISLELPQEIHQRLISRAERDGRPLVDVAALLLEQALRDLADIPAAAADL